MPPRLLLGPGPSLVDPRVLRAMSTPLVGHLDPAFLKLMDRTQELLRYVFQTANRLTVPVSGTGSAAMEAAIANMVEPGDPVLVCINGYFGQRQAEMARRYGGAVQEIHRPWGEVFTVEEIAAALAERPARRGMPGTGRNIDRRAPTRTRYCQPRPCSRWALDCRFGDLVRGRSFVC